MLRLKWLCAIVIVIGVATVIGQIAAILTVNGIVGYSEVRAVRGAVMPTANVRCYSLDFYRAHLKGEYPEHPSFSERILTAQGILEMPEQPDAPHAESSSVNDLAGKPSV